MNHGTSWQDQISGSTGAGFGALLLTHLGAQVIWHLPQFTGLVLAVDLRGACSSAAQHACRHGGCPNAAGSEYSGMEGSVRDADSKDLNRL